MQTYNGFCYILQRLDIAEVNMHNTLKQYKEEVLEGYLNISRFKKNKQGLICLAKQYNNIVVNLYKFILDRNSILTFEEQISLLRKVSYVYQDIAYLEKDNDIINKILDHIPDLKNMFYVSTKKAIVDFIRKFLSPLNEKSDIHYSAIDLLESLSVFAILRVNTNFAARIESMLASHIKESLSIEQISDFVEIYFSYIGYFNPHKADILKNIIYQFTFDKDGSGQSMQDKNRSI